MNLISKSYFFSDQIEVKQRTEEKTFYQITISIFFLYTTAEKDSQSKSNKLNDFIYQI